MTVNELETNLNSFSQADRMRAIAALVLQNPDISQKTSASANPAGEIANMHCHSFFSNTMLTAIHRLGWPGWPGSWAAH